MVATTEKLLRRMPGANIPLRRMLRAPRDFLLRGPLGVTSQDQKRLRHEKPTRLIYIDYFRAISILLIVAGHSYNNWNRDATSELLVASIITGGTALFVFISGFFFHNTFYPKFQFTNFLAKKATNIFTPYLLMTAIFLIIAFTINCKIPEQFVKFDHNIINVIGTFIQYIITGRALTGYWYITFIMIVFAISPVFIKFIELNRNSQISIFFALTLLSMYVQRPMYNMNPIHSVIYFLPFYLFGILYSQSKSFLDRCFSSKVFLLAAIVVSISFLKVSLGQSDGNLYKNLWAWNGLDLMVLQKLFLILFLVALCQKLEIFRLSLLCYIADISFAIYFLHPWVLWVLIYQEKVIADIQHGLLGVVVIFLVTSIISIIIANLVKLALKEKSRYIIGW
jgi:peptidoglycan/LPS O-acetylase OafA/YrhL